MGASKRARRPLDSRLRSANEKWKGRWSSWVALSTIVGAVAHAVIFAVWPMWQLTAANSRARIEVVQLEPIMSAGALTDPGEEVIAAPPREQETELEITDMGDGGDVLLEELFEVFGLPSPTVANPVPQRPEFGSRAAPLPPLSLDHVQAISPQLAQATAPVVLPLIRNPTVLQRFLRMRYNPHHRDPGSNVSVSMWVNERGTVEWAEVSQSSGYPMVDEIALDVFNQVVVFAPARMEGSRVPVSLVITVPFTAPW